MEPVTSNGGYGTVGSTVNGTPVAAMEPVTSEGDTEFCGKRDWTVSTLQWSP